VEAVGVTALGGIARAAGPRQAGAGRGASAELAALRRLRQARDEQAHTARKAFLAGLGPDNAELLRAEQHALRASTNLDLLVAQRRLDDATGHYLPGSPDPELGALPLRNHWRTDLLR
jgi:hypothetical protein